MITIFVNIQSARKDVIVFLKELKILLEKEDFNMDIDLTLIQKTKKGNDIYYSTPYTLVDLEYDVEDVVDRLKELKLEEYSETKIDRDDSHPPLLFVFGKNINNRLVYIKLKIKEKHRKHVVCVSFHYAKEKMTFPYT